MTTLPDSKKSIPARPTHYKKFDSESKERILRKVEEQINKIYDPAEVGKFTDEAEVVLAEANRDGYHLAKLLDEYCGWDNIDSFMVEQLATLGHTIYLAEREELANWIKHNDIKCPFKLNSIVTFKHINTLQKGKIIKINKEYGEVYIFCKELGHVRSGQGTNAIILPYEKVICDDCKKPKTKTSEDVRYLCPSCYEKIVNRRNNRKDKK